MDEVGILSKETKLSIDKKLKEHEKQTSNQVVVLIIPSLEGEILEEYSLKIASTWKLGQKGKDNGVLLLIAKNDRKMRIEVGYGLEGTLTDVLSNRIIRNEIAPAFKKENYSAGVEQGVDAIIGAIKGTYKPEAENTNSPGLDMGLPWYFSIIIGLMFFAFMTPFVIATATTPYIGWFLYFFLMPFFGTFPVVIFGSKGFIVLPIYAVFMFIAKVYLGFTDDGKKFMEKHASKIRAGSSSSSSSSGRSSGSSSGGGFSGGGGSFGGGGSSGSW
ncbi:MAG: TPM domain-containing protein [Leptospiraceae bacterium]|nr:TPM domain-containing protein [Leptospiraceae bacterium]